MFDEYFCLVTNSVLMLFLAVLWVGLQCVLVAFPAHTYVLTLYSERCILKGTYQSSKSSKIWKKMVLRANYIIFCGKKISYLR